MSLGFAWSSVLGAHGKVKCWSKLDAGWRVSLFVTDIDETKRTSLKQVHHLLSRCQKELQECDYP
jgi:hypothetical protein